MNKPKKVMEETESPTVYSKARKHYLDRIGEINCVLCPYHRKENAERWQRSWKRTTKRKKQYKTK